MILVIDAGNTNIVAGVFDQGLLIDTLRIHTNNLKTEDEYAVIVKAILVNKGIDIKSINKIIVSSVVPQLTVAIIKMAEHLFSITPVLLGPQIYDKLPIKMLSPHEIGSDIVANTTAAWLRFNSACLIVDFGTALTFTAVDKYGLVKGVAIAPGLGTAAGALSKATAQLPLVPLDTPRSALGTNTIEAIQAGVVLGYTGLVEYMVAKMKEELGGAKVIATGGMCKLIKTNVFDAIDQNLTLIGLSKMEKYFYKGQ